MVLPSQLQPAKAVWPKAEARPARMAWERSVESLGIWAHGWSKEQRVEQHTDNGEEAAARQLRVLQGDAVSWEQHQMELEGMRMTDKGKSVLTNTELEVASAKEW